MTKPNHDRKKPTFAHISAVVLAIQRSIRISLKTHIHTCVIVRRTSRLLKTGKMWKKTPVHHGIPLFHWWATFHRHHQRSDDPEVTRADPNDVAHCALFFLSLSLSQSPSRPFASRDEVPPHRGKKKETEELSARTGKTIFVISLLFRL